MQAYDEAVSISPRVRRLVAQNPGAMTGPGTNTYLVGNETLALIDPGPSLDEHIEHILEVGDGKITHIFCTHTHPDHSPAAAPIAKELSIPMIGAVTADDRHQDLTFNPDIHLTHDATFSGPDWTIRGVATPGHGDVIPDCRGEVEKLVRHRLMREAKVVAALQREGPIAIESLVVSVYDDVPVAMHPWAQLSLLAHLLKLEVEERAEQRDGQWAMR